MTHVQSHLKPNELKPLHALLLTHQQALLQVERTREALAAEHGKLLEKWQSKLETLREKADRAEEAALDQGESTPDLTALEEIQVLVDALESLNPDDAAADDLDEMLQLTAER
ncbi:hypothetical protein [Deinococcus sp. UYEF24]